MGILRPLEIAAEWLKNEIGLDKTRSEVTRGKQRGPGDVGPRVTRSQMDRRRIESEQILDLTEETLAVELLSLEEDIVNWNHGHPMNVEGVRFRVSQSFDRD